MSTTTVVSWIRYPQLEALIDSRAVAYTTVDNHPLSDINRDMSRHNRARIDAPIDWDKVESILTVGRITGHLILPYMLGYRPALGQPVVLADGNHRYEVADKLGQKTCGLYMMGPGTKPAVIDEITRQVNLLNGRDQPLIMRLEHAVHVAKARSGEAFPADDVITTVAEMFSVSFSRLKDRLRLDSFRSRLAGGDLAVPGAELLSDDVLLALMGLRDAIATKIITAGIIEHGVTDPERVRAMTEDVRKETDPLKKRAEAAAQVGTLKFVRKVDAGQATVTGDDTGPATRIIADLKRLTRTLTTRLPATRRAASVFKTEAQRDGVAGMAAAIAARLTALKAELDALKK